MPKHDSWTTESGLLDEFDFKVEEAWFGPNEDSERDPDKIYLNLRGVATVDGEVEDDEHTERYSIGNGWEVVEDGAEVEDARGRFRFNQNTGLGRLINALVGLGDDEAEYMSGRGQAYEASTFEGLKMEMERVLVSKFETDDGETVEWFLPLPVSLTVKKAKKGKKGGSGKASRGKGKGSKKSGLRSEVIEFATEFDEDEHDEFVDQVLDEEVFDKAEQITEDDELHAEILDPDSELWTEAHS